MPEHSTALAAYADRYDSVRAALPGADQNWLQDMRDAGLKRFMALGFPGPREESWRFTNLRALTDTALEPLGSVSVHASDLARLLPQDIDAACGARLVFVNGVAVPELWQNNLDISGLHIASLADEIAENPEWVAAHLGHLLPMGSDSIAALNTALMQDGYVIRVDRKATISKPIHIVSIGTANGALSFHPRGILSADALSKVSVIESHVGTKGSVYFSNPAIEIFVGENAQVGHYRLQDDSKDAFNIGRFAVQVRRDGRFDGFSLATGARLSRNEGSLTLAETGSHLAINGAYLLRGNQQSDLTTVIDHAAAHTTSHESVKGVLDGSAHGVFQGQLKVRKDSQKVDGYQMNRALLLSPKAVVNAKPELEIFADDVKCSHGATIGELDANQLFYLRARGIPEATARQMLVAAFVSEAIEAIEDDVDTAETWGGLQTDLSNPVGYSTNPFDSYVPGQVLHPDYMHDAKRIFGNT